MTTPADLIALAENTLCLVPANITDMSELEFAHYMQDKMQEYMRGTLKLYREDFINSLMEERKNWEDGFCSGQEACDNLLKIWLNAPPTRLVTKEPT